MIIRSIHALSDLIARCEGLALRALVLVLPVMVLINVTGRAFRSPIYWMDELAVLSMCWLAIIGMSLTLKTRDAVAVTMVQDALPPRLTKLLRVLSDTIVLGFAIALVVFCYLWFDPLLLVKVDFDLKAFAAQSFNYVYDEPTSTLGVPMFWFWLIVPVAACTCAVHALSNLLRTLLQQPAAPASDSPIASSGADT